MHIPSPRGKKRARIEIIPLIDIIFFLLATFVLVSLSMVKQRGIAVNLPAASTADAQERNDFAAISVLADGSLYFNKARITVEDLPARIQLLKGMNPDPKVYINGDADSHFGVAVAVLDEVRKAGITKVAIETRPKQ